MEEIIKEHKKLLTGIESELMMNGQDSAFQSLVDLLQALLSVKTLNAEINKFSDVLEHAHDSTATLRRKITLKEVSEKFSVVKERISHSAELFFTEMQQIKPDASFLATRFDFLK